MEQSKQVEIINALLSDDSNKGSMVYNNDLKTFLYEIELPNPVYDENHSSRFILHPNGNLTPHDISSVFKLEAGTQTHSYALRLHYDLDKFYKNKEDNIEIVQRIVEMLTYPKSIFDCDISNFDRYIGLLNDDKIDKKEFYNAVARSVFNFNDELNCEYKTYLLDNNVDFDEILSGKVNKHDLIIIQKHLNDLFDSTDNVLAKSKIIVNNVLAYIALSQSKCLKKEIEKLPIKHFDEIKEYVENNPVLNKVLTHGLNNIKSIEPTR